uniref:Secreted protein n=1 Tax=Trichogramma kaykai TaxID=54128 RepID=A0ABD2WH71_9HYME
MCFCATLQHALSAVLKFSRRRLTEARDANYNIINIYSVYNTCHRCRCRQYTIFAFASRTYTASVSLLVATRASDELCQLMMMNCGCTAANRESKFTFDHLAIVITQAN